VICFTVSLRHQFEETAVVCLLAFVRSMTTPNLGVTSSAVFTRFDPQCSSLLAQKGCCTCI